jgi:hypothetical protein
MESNTIILWTDRPEFAIYAEYFNASQSQYKAETHYFVSPAEKLVNTDDRPDVVVGSWLKSASTRMLFEPLDVLFKSDLSEESFYKKLLDLGVIDEEHYLLPVSFNTPALVFARSNRVENPFTISLEDTKKIGKAYNVMQRGSYSRIGFSPDWNSDFLFVSAALLNADFREDAPLSWNADALEAALEYDKAWITEANTSIQAVDDFAFKYFFAPPERRVAQGRILFTYMTSAELFTLDMEQLSELDFRWLAEQDRIPLIENSVYYGICKRGRAAKGSKAFTKWFFQAETQRMLLENSRRQQLNDTLFGIAGGFSAMRNVTEDIFPRFYPILLGHIPPDAFLTPPSILPQNWLDVKEKVILPYMHEYIRTEDTSAIRPLDKRVSDWYRINN